MLSARVILGPILSFFVLSALPAKGNLIEDKGIYLAGPFGVPDITKPPAASAEAVFLSGSLDSAPFYLNALVLGSGDAHFSDNGWVYGKAFSFDVIRNGSSLQFSWNLSGAPFVLSYISVNFDNDFYHVYKVDDSAQLDDFVTVTGNLRDPIGHVRFFGFPVPESGSSSTLLLLGAGALALGRRLFH